MKWGRTFGVGALLLIAVLALIAFALVQSHAHRIWGGYVERIDAEAFRVAERLTAITDVRVLSRDGERMSAPRTVVFDGDRVVAILDGDPPPVNAVVVEGRGKFLIPGLIDAHVHLRRQPNDLLLYLANGITHVRDLSGSEFLLELRDEIAEGRAGPRLDVASPLLFTTSLVQGWFRESTEPRENVRHPDDAHVVVRKLVERGYDALKLYSDIDPDVFRAINRAADRTGIHTIGHLPLGHSADELSNSGLDELGHIEEIVKLLQTEFDPAQHGPYSEAFPSFVEARADAIIDDLLNNDITVNTTLWLMEVVGKQAFDLRGQLARLPLEYANPAMVEGSPYVASVGWLPGRNGFEVQEDPGPEEQARTEASWEARAEAHRVLFRAMVSRGVRLTAGTDATSHLMIPGFSLHDELESLVRNGMTTAQSLRTATMEPARVMGSNAGRIEVGAAADLVLLSANPLEDISHISAIEAVIAQGRLYEREMLDDMLARVAQANAASRTFDLGDYLETSP